MARAKERSSTAVWGNGNEFMCYLADEALSPPPCKLYYWRLKKKNVDGVAAVAETAFYTV